MQRIHPFGSRSLVPWDISRRAKQKSRSLCTEDGALGMAERIEPDCVAQVLCCFRGLKSTRRTQKIVEPRIVMAVKRNCPQDLQGAPGRGSINVTVLCGNGEPFHKGRLKISFDSGIDVAPAYSFSGRHLFNERLVI